MFVCRFKYNTTALELATMVIFPAKVISSEYLLWNKTALYKAAVIKFKNNFVMVCLLIVGEKELLELQWFLATYIATTPVVLGFDKCQPNMNWAQSIFACQCDLSELS